MKPPTLVGIAEALLDDRKRALVMAEARLGNAHTELTTAGNAWHTARNGVVAAEATLFATRLLDHDTETEGTES